MDAEVFLIREFTQKGSPLFFFLLFALLLAEMKERRQKERNNRW